MASFVPPLFSKLGESAQNLFTKRYDFKTIVQNKHKTASGVVFVSGAEVGKGGNGVLGNMKVVYKKDTFGDVEGEISTSGKGKGFIKAKKLAPGTTVTLTGDLQPKEHPKDPSVKLGVDYKQEFFSGQASVETAFFEHTKLVGAGVIGYDGISVGGEFKLDAANSLTDVEDYNVGAQFDASDFNVTLKTAAQGSVATLSYFHKISKEHKVGASITSRIDGEVGSSETKDLRGATLGTEYAVDDKTNLKLKANTEGVFSSLIEHRLKNPSLLFALASSWDVNSLKNISGKEVGVGLTFGDYDADNEA
jgi:hypothetical protein